MKKVRLKRLCIHALIVLLTANLVFSSAGSSALALANPEAVQGEITVYSQDYRLASARSNITPHVDSVEDVAVEDIEEFAEENGIDVATDELPATLAGEGLPSRYSLVDEGRVTAVKNQGTTGTCWAFSAVAAAESSLLTQNIVDASINLSEKHLAYFTYNATTDRLRGTAGDTVQLLNGNNYLTVGGNDWITMNRLAAWYGMVKEDKECWRITDGSTGFPAAQAYDDNDYVLDNAYIVSLKDTNDIKNLIMEKGACDLTMFMYSNTYSGYYNYFKAGSNGEMCHYQDVRYDTNHIVNLVGWDDNYSRTNFARTPAGDGAWLVRNSWGSTNDNGYFWLSYYDNSVQPYCEEKSLNSSHVCTNKCSKVYGDVYFYEMEPVEAHQNIYQYDGGVGKTSISVATNSYLYCSAIFASDGDGSGSTDKELLTDVALCTVQPNTFYTVQVYANVSDGGKPTDGTPVFSEPISGYLPYAGYHTIDLRKGGKNILLDEGERFSVVIGYRYADGQTRIPVDQSFAWSWLSGTSSAKARQCFFSTTGNAWSDITSIAGGSTYSARIKAKTAAFIPFDRITLNAYSAELLTSDTLQLTTAFEPAENDYSDCLVTWSSSNPSVASVSQTGVVIGIAPGEATITAASCGKQAACTVTVNKRPVETVTLGTVPAEIYDGETVTLSASVLPANATYPTVSWSSSDPAVLTVSPDGIVTATGVGTAVITAEADGRTAVCTIKVLPIAVTSVSLNKSNAIVHTGETLSLSASVAPANASDPTLRWSSSDNSIATVDESGNVTGVSYSAAPVTITAASSDGPSAYCMVTVNENYGVKIQTYAGASKLYEPWGLRYYASYQKAPGAAKEAELGMAILKDTFYTARMTAKELCENANAHVFLRSTNAIDETTLADGTVKYFATLQEGIYSYDIDALYYVVPFAVMSNGQVEYGTIVKSSMNKILNSNLDNSEISAKEKAVCTAILELKESVSLHYAASGVPSAAICESISRGSEQTAAANSTNNTDYANVESGASRLIEPWGLRYFATYIDSDDIDYRGMVMLNESFYNAEYSDNRDSMRCDGNAYVFTEADNTLHRGSDGTYYATLTEGISSKNISDKYCVLPFVVLKDGTYVYGAVKRNSMYNILKYNIASTDVSATEKSVSQDIIDLYNAVCDYYKA